MKLDMHCHTKEGSLDGKVPIEEYIALLMERGFDGMLVTDHNSYGGYRKWKTELKGRKYKKFVVLKGVEYDTIDAGHILVIMPETVHLKILELRGLPLSLLIDIVHRNGGILGPAHACGEKYLSLTNTRRYRKQKHILTKFDFLEEFNACESPQSNRTAAMLAQTYHLPGIGGSDSHVRDCIGTAYTILEGRINRESELISYIKEKRKISCGGTCYAGTVKSKIGMAKNILVESFWLYNKMAGIGRKYSRNQELKKDKTCQY